MHILNISATFWAKRFVIFYQSVVCVSFLSVTFVHCGQMVGRIKIKLGMQVGLGPGHIVLGGDPAPLPQRGVEPPSFWPISVAAKWLDGSRCHLVWTEVGLSPGDFVLDGNPTLCSPKMGAEPPSPIFGPFLLWSNGCNTAACNKMPLGMEVSLSPGDFVLDGNPPL